MRTDSCDLSVGKDQDGVCLADGGDSLSDEKDAGARHAFRDGMSQACLGGGVQSGGAVVQNEEAWLADECAGNGDALLLAAR